MYTGEGAIKFPSGKLPISLSTGGKEYEVGGRGAPPTFPPTHTHLKNLASLRTSGKRAMGWRGATPHP